MSRSAVIFGGLAIAVMLWLSPGTPVRASARRPHFADVAPRSAISYITNNSYTGRKYFQQPMCGGIGILDYDNDGRMDIFFSNGAQLPELKKTGPAFYNCLLRNKGDGTFEDVTAKAGVAGEHLDYSYGVAVGDYDNDGFPDIFIANTGKNTLYHNNGNGTFTDVTDQSGLGAKPPKTLSVQAAWFDYDNDGLLDLAVSNYTLWTPGDDRPCSVRGVEAYCHPQTYPAVPHRLYHNLGGGKFEDVTEKSGFGKSLGKGMGIGIADFNNDGWMDVFIANDTERNFLFLNQGDGTFKEVGLDFGVAYNDEGATVSAMGADAKDYDNDGFVDIFYNDLMGQTWALFRNQRGKSFRYSSPSTKIVQLSQHLSGWSNGFIDYDNDGWKDIFSANGDVDNLTPASPQNDTMFENDGGKGFVDVSRDMGADFLRLGYQRGSAFADLNNDGFMDLVVTSLNQKPRILVNSADNGNHWLLLKLVGRKANRDAIGAKVKVTTPSGRTLYNHVAGSVGFMSTSDLRLHFGLGSETMAAKIEIELAGRYGSNPQRHPCRPHTPHRRASLAAQTRSLALRRRSTRVFQRHRLPGAAHDDPKSRHVTELRKFTPTDVLHSAARPDRISADRSFRTKMSSSNRSGFNRRKFLGAAAFGGLLQMSERRAGAAVNRNSTPSQLRITDMRSVLVASNYDYPIIRIDTNQGVYGLGEVRDAGREGMALVLKPHLVGRNPLNIEPILDSVRSFANQQRMGGGYSGIDMALHDIAGKVYDVPAWRLVGSKYRDRIRVYCDTTESKDPKVYGERMRKRKEAGFTFFKMDLLTSLVSDRQGAINTRGTATPKGLEYLCEYIAAVRDVIGYEHPLAADHFGPLTLKDSIRYARAFEPYDLAWAEDMIQVDHLGAGGDAPKNWRAYKELKESTTTPICTGESLFGLEGGEGFQELIENRAVDIVHCDPETSGGIRETKRIGDFAAMNGVQTAIHFAGSPVGCMASVHMAATLKNMLAMENHAIDIPWWGDLVSGPSKPIVNRGYITVPDTPGIGVELNEAAVKEHIRKGGYFEPTPQYDDFILDHFRQGGPYPHLDEDGKMVNSQ